ncbi:unnamed protein product [Nyctereutes procyonoides]|uniref:(raccoon dog) hypothetical protein n=1 Tax=Nyctereutes procyonoides TaxID=34880 RepID=A0A811YLH3_NYCPR|nr:unnamed protein product [Nyctereutes procyonoides]
MLTTRFLGLRSVITPSGCGDKGCTEQDRLAESTWQCPPCYEDWDKDLWEQTHTPFVWGTASYCGNNSPASNVVIGQKSNLESGMRVEMHSN